VTFTLQDFRAYATGNMMDLEAILTEIYTAHLEGQSGYSLFDGGANNGHHTRLMVALPGCDRVYSVEADPFIVEDLKTRLGRLETEVQDRITIVEKALQNDPATTEIPWGSSSSHVGRSSILSDNAARPTIWGDDAGVEYRDKMTVPATTIDTILAEDPAPVPFLKLDLEGADLLALTGAETTLSEKRPIVAYENSVHAPRVHGFSMEDIAAYFDRLGYVALDFIGRPVTPETWFGFFEAWAVPQEDTDWLKDALRDSVGRRMS
jgi:FkbM family methyltransferase